MGALRIVMRRVLLLLLCSSFCITGLAQAATDVQFRKASKKVVKGFEKNDTDTLAQGYFDLAESYYEKGDLQKSEFNYKKSKGVYEKLGNAEGIAKSSRALAKIQEDLHKNKEAIQSYNVSQANTVKTGDAALNTLNSNDIKRLLQPDSIELMQKLLQDNIDLGIKNKDSNEVVTNYSRMAQLSSPLNTTNTVSAYNNAYNFSKNKPGQALRFNQLITDIYVKEKKFDKAIETKKQGLSESFVQNSTLTKATEITSLADIYLQKLDDTTAIRLLMESYDISVRNGHTLEARKNVEKLDSIYQRKGEKDKSLALYHSFLFNLPAIIAKDSSLMESRGVAETEEKIKKLETEKQLKDELIREKSLINYWLFGSVAVLVILLGIILYTLKKIKIKNKKIALQSLRREMNPHFIFNSLNSINQFISNNNELEANRYLTKFSTLMRRVMENSKEDFVLFANEIELLRIYLDLEKSRFPDKFDYSIHIEDSLYQYETLHLPGMLIQPYLENAVWHGLRYTEEGGFLRLSFYQNKTTIDIRIEDNGIGIAESKRVKSANQKTHTGRGITNTLERIKILNELYHQHITCIVEDKPVPDHGVLVQLSVPLLKNRQYEN